MGFHITYDSMDGHYIVQPNYGEVQLNKDGMGLPYINIKKKDADFVQTVREIFEVLTKK